MCELYEQGTGLDPLGRKFKCSGHTVKRVLLENGIQIRTQGHPTGQNHPGWRGGKHINDQGYVMVKLQPDHPYYSMAYANGYVLKHRLVMAQSLGRPLTKKETVHHKDLNRKNNRRSNLQLRHGKHGKGAVLKCADCGSHNLVAMELT
jgi:hypothetical protein